MNSFPVVGYTNKIDFYKQREFPLKKVLMKTSEIIQAILNKEGLTYSIFAKYIKVAPKEVYDLLNGRTKSITSKFAEKILAVYPYYNIIWLRTGLGEMFKSDVDRLAARGRKELLMDEQGTIHLQEAAKLIPHIIEGCADCGKPNGFDIAITEDRCPKYIIPGLVGCDFTIPARGRSMINKNIPEKSIKDGDIIGCRKWNSRSHIRWGEVYVLSTTEGITVKQIEPSDKEGYIKCVPFNTDEGFQSFEIPVDEIYDWAIVVGVASISMWS